MPTVTVRPSPTACSTISRRGRAAGRAIAHRLAHGNSRPRIAGCLERGRRDRAQAGRPAARRALAGRRPLPLDARLAAGRGPGRVAVAICRRVLRIASRGWHFPGRCEAGNRAAWRKPRVAPTLLQVENCWIPATFTPWPKSGRRSSMPWRGWPSIARSPCPKRSTTTSCRGTAAISQLDRIHGESADQRRRAREELVAAAGKQPLSELAVAGCASYRPARRMRLSGSGP